MTSQPRILLQVFVGGCAGGAARHVLAGSSATTLAVNLLGCFVLGVLVVAAPHRWRALLGTGLCGGFTTFGSVMLVSEQWLEDGRAATAVGYLALSLLGGIAAAAVGIGAGHALSHRSELAPEDPDVEVD